MVNLYEYNKITGYWKLVRSHEIEDAEEWQRVFHSDAPDAYFWTAKRRPTFNPVARNREA